MADQVYLCVIRRASLQDAAQQLKVLAEHEFRYGTRELGITSAELALRASFLSQSFDRFESTECFLAYLRSSFARREPRPRRLPRARERET
jgi:hypothetical protein